MAIISEDAKPRTGVPAGPGQPLEEQIRALTSRLQALEGKVAANATADRLSMVVFSGSLDRMLASFVLATTAAASGMEVDMFFTFWGLAALRDPAKSAKKDLIGRMFGWMLPRGMKKLPMSQLQMGGAGPAMIRHVVRTKKMPSLAEVLETWAGA